MWVRVGAGVVRSVGHEIWGWLYRLCGAGRGGGTVIVDKGGAVVPVAEFSGFGCVHEAEWTGLGESRVMGEVDGVLQG